MYSVVGYDKDSDTFETLWETNNLDNAITQGTIFAHRQRETELRRRDNNEPFYWFAVIDTNNEDIVYWASYEKPVGSCDFDEHENDNYWLGDSEVEKTVDTLNAVGNVNAMTPNEVENAIKEAQRDDLDGHD